MNDFLNFLNTADLDSLTKTPGITRVIAGNIIAKRPFDSVEECLHVRGMGKSLLAKMQSNFEAEQNASASRAMVTVQEEAPVYIEKSQPAQESPKKEEDSFWSRLGQAFISFIRALFRLIAIMIVIGGIGAGIYAVIKYGIPYFNQEVIVPIEKNSAQIETLSSEIKTLQAQLDETNSRVGTLEKSIEANTASLTKLDQIQAELENKIQKSSDENLLQLKHEVMYTRALDMLGRARLYLAQSNFGLAREDVKSARELLGELQSESEDKTLDQAIVRLDMVLDNLPAFPVVAAGDLEIAWQILVNGEAPATATPVPTATSTPTAVPPLEATPTPVQ
jgi:DNA uptake protein ComE-like DNA-binding protein